MSKLDEIEERWAKARHGTWHARRHTVCDAVEQGHVLSDTGRFVAETDDPDDAEAIAADHNDIAYLLRIARKAHTLMQLVDGAMRMGDVGDFRDECRTACYELDDAFDEDA